MFNLEKVKEGDKLSARRHNALVDAVQQNRALPNSFADGKGVYGRRTRGQAGAGTAVSLILARITGSQAADDPAQNRWKYSWQEIQKNAVGYGGWINGERSGTLDAFNSIEDMNDNIGEEGNGVNVDGIDFPPGFEIKPAAIGAIILLREAVFSVGETTYTEYWFAYENAVDGTCLA